MKNKRLKVKDMKETISEISRLVDGLYEKTDGSKVLVKSLDRISLNVELLKMNVNGLLELG